MTQENVSIISGQDYDRLLPDRLMPDSLDEHSMYRLLARSHRFGGRAMFATAIFEGVIRRFDGGHILGDLRLIGSDLQAINKSLRSVVDDQGYWMPASGVEATFNVTGETTEITEGYLLPSEEYETNDSLPTEINLQRYDMLHSPPLAE